LSEYHHKRGAPPTGDGLRRALRWLSEQRRHDLTAVEEACRLFDLSPLDEEFLINESRRIAEAAPHGTPTLESTIARPREEDEHLTAEGVRILESWNLPLDPAASIARARLLPGEATQWHYLEGTIERYLVVTGTGQVEVGDDAPQAVGPGDVVFIPAGIAQRIVCTGADELVFYCVCTPRFEERNYRSGKPSP
jgi:mannose-6-phosphate isomerase-like protein (cupin superfamily)